MMSEVSFRGSPAWLGGQVKSTFAAQKPKPDKPELNIDD